MFYLVKITGTQQFKGFQMAAHSKVGRWETLYGEFTQQPKGTIGYEYYSSSVVSVSVETWHLAISYFEQIKM